jgi:hypothetical protein
MIKHVLTASALSVLVFSPALAIAPTCTEQLSEIKGQLADHPDAQISAKYKEAERLCSDKKDIEAQALTKDIREQMARKTGGDTGAAGSTTAPATPTTTSGPPKTESK